MRKQTEIEDIQCKYEHNLLQTHTFLVVSKLYSSIIVFFFGGGQSLARSIAQPQRYNLATTRNFTWPVLPLSAMTNMQAKKMNKTLSTPSSHLVVPLNEHFLLNKVQVIACLQDIWKPRQEVTVPLASQFFQCTQKMLLRLLVSMNELKAINTGRQLSKTLKLAILFKVSTGIQKNPFFVCMHPNPQILAFKPRK